jgi:hypothetical protein
VKIKIPAGLAAMGADGGVCAGSPLCNRNSATNRVVAGFLARFKVQHVFRCCTLRGLRSPYFIGFVALLRFETPLGGKEALEGLVELLAEVAAWCLVHQSDHLRRDAQWPQQPRKLVGRDGLTRSAVFAQA